MDEGTEKYKIIMDNIYDPIMYPNEYNHYKVMSIYFSGVCTTGLMASLVHTLSPLELEYVNEMVQLVVGGFGTARTGTERNLTSI